MRLQRRLAASHATPARATAPRLTGPPKGVERAPPGAGGRSRRVGQEPGLPGRGEVACLIKHQTGGPLPHPRAGMKSDTQDPPVVKRAAPRALRGPKAVIWALGEGTSLTAMRVGGYWPNWPSSRKDGAAGNLHRGDAAFFNGVKRHSSNPRLYID